MLHGQALHGGMPFCIAKLQQKKYGDNAAEPKARNGAKGENMGENLQRFQQYGNRHKSVFTETGVSKNSDMERVALDENDKSLKEENKMLRSKILEMEQKMNFCLSSLNAIMGKGQISLLKPDAVPSSVLQNTMDGSYPAEKPVMSQHLERPRYTIQNQPSAKETGLPTCIVQEDVSLVTLKSSASPSTGNQSKISSPRESNSTGCALSLSGTNIKMCVGNSVAVANDIELVSNESHIDALEKNSSGIHQETIGGNQDSILLKHPVEKVFTADVEAESRVKELTGRLVIAPLKDNLEIVQINIESLSPKEEGQETKFQVDIEEKETFIDLTEDEATDGTTPNKTDLKWTAASPETSESCQKGQMKHVQLQPAQGQDVAFPVVQQQHRRDMEESGAMDLDDVHCVWVYNVPVDLKQTKQGQNNVKGDVATVPEDVPPIDKQISQKITSPGGTSKEQEENNGKKEVQRNSEDIAERDTRKHQEQNLDSFDLLSGMEKSAVSNSFDNMMSRSPQRSEVSENNNKPGHRYHYDVLSLVTKGNNANVEATIKKEFPSPCDVNSVISQKSGRERANMLFNMLNLVAQSELCLESLNQKPSNQTCADEEQDPIDVDMVPSNSAKHKRKLDPDWESDKSVTSSDVESSESLTSYRRKRFKNNIASKRCRDAKKKLVIDLELEAKKLTDRNQLLHRKILLLENLAKEMKETLIAFSKNRM